MGQGERGGLAGRPEDFEERKRVLWRNCGCCGCCVSVLLSLLPLPGFPERNLVRSLVSAAAADLRAPSSAVLRVSRAAAAAERGRCGKRPARRAVLGFGGNVLVSGGGAVAGGGGEGCHTERPLSSLCFLLLDSTPFRLFFNTFKFERLQL